ncbi:hypothetical protein WT33_15805 [Burkholderia stagnalis]|nr:hypothetical protein WT33_15805 [Burkholderia stagnalis]
MDLLPCPFCGADATTSERGKGASWHPIIACVNWCCSVSGTGGTRDGMRASALKLWNTRAVLAASPVEQPAAAPADERATWSNARDSLAVAMSGFAGRSGNRDFNTAIGVLDAITEPGLPLAWLRTARAASANETGAEGVIPTGYCERAGGCVCGGDLPRVREGCAEWVRPSAAQPSAQAAVRNGLRDDEQMNGCDRSAALNRVIWKLMEAMGRIPKGAEAVEADVAGVVNSACALLASRLLMPWFIGVDMAAPGTSDTSSCVWPNCGCDHPSTDGCGNTRQATPDR